MITSNEVIISFLQYGQTINTEIILIIYLVLIKSNIIR